MIDFQSRTTSYDRRDHVANDGTKIAVYQWQSAAPKAVVQILHGMAEHAKRYAYLAEALTRSGFIVYAHDHRGHGETAASDQDLGYISNQNSWRRMVDDALEISRHIRQAHPELPLVLFGHSMGSFMARQALLEEPELFSAAIFSATSGKPSPLLPIGRVVARAERARLGARGKSSVLQKLTFGDFNKKFRPNRTAYDWLSRDSAQVDRYINDSRCGFICAVQTWIDLFDALPALVRPQNLRSIPREKPIYFVSGSDDPVGGEKQIQWLANHLRKLGFSNVTDKIYPGGRHEMVNETNRDEMISDLISWIKQTLRV